MRATSPSGQAEYEGRVSWSGELGFGVRQPERGQTALPALMPGPAVDDPAGDDPAIGQGHA